MSTHNICFCREIRKYRYFLVEKAPYQELWVRSKNYLYIKPMFIISI